MISVVQLGTVDYATGLRLQEQLVALRKEEKIGDVLLLLEHKPVITLGRNAKAANVLASRELLARRGVELFECDRGGDVTFHGPGQVVGYPIFDLRGYPRSSSLSSQAKESDSNHPSLKPRDLARRPGTDRIGHDSSHADRGPNGEAASAAGVAPRKHLGAVDFIRSLEDVLIRTCAGFAIPTKRVQGLTGVWTDVPSENSDSSRPAVSKKEVSNKGDSSKKDSNKNENASAADVEAKLAAMGIHISRFVTSHGFALNVNNDLSYFDLIIPCGIAAKPVTSMQQQLGRDLDLNAVAESISRNFGVVFQSQILWVDTLDALLGRSVGVPMQPPSELRRLHHEDGPTWA